MQSWEEINNSLEYREGKRSRGMSKTIDIATAKGPDLL